MTLETAVRQVRQVRQVTEVAVEIVDVLHLQAVRNLNPLICRFYFLDGKAKAMGVNPTSTATDVIKILAEKIDLQNVAGWALYEVLS